MPEINADRNDRRLMSLLGNLASFAWGALAAAWTLEALGHTSPTRAGRAGLVPAVAIAGLALILVSYFYMTVITGPLKNGIGLWTLTRRELIPTCRSTYRVIAASVVTALLYDEIGLVGLLPLLGVVFLPRLLVPIMLRDAPIWDLSIGEATARYAGGLAEVLGLSSIAAPDPARRRHPPRRRARLTRIDDFDAVMQTVLYSHEHWDGRRRARPRVG